MQGRKVRKHVRQVPCLALSAPMLSHCVHRTKSRVIAIVRVREKHADPDAD